MAKKLNHHLLKRGDSYYLQVVVNGLRVREALSKDATEARSLRDQMMAELRWGHLKRSARERYFRYIPNLTHQDGSGFQEKFGKALAEFTQNLPQNEKGKTISLVIPFDRYKN